MKKLMLLAFGCLIALPSLLVAQNDPATLSKIASTVTNEINSFTASQNERKFMIVEYFPGTDSVKAKYLVTNVKYITDGSISYLMSPADTAFLFIPSDASRKLKGTVNWKWADQRYDTTFTLKETIDDPSTTGTRWSITNMSKATNSTKTGVYNKSFTYVTVTSTASSAKITTVMDRIEFFGETWTGHGWIKFFIDGQQVAMQFKGNAPYVTDFTQMKPSFYWNFPKANPNDPAKEHTFEIKTDPGNQYIIDMIRTFTYTLKPR